MCVKCYHEGMSKIRKMAINIVKKHDKTDDLEYWRSKSESERVSAIEFLREQYYVLSGETTVPRLAHTFQKRKSNRI